MAVIIALFFNYNALANGGGFAGAMNSMNGMGSAPMSGVPMTLSEDPLTWVDNLLQQGNYDEARKYLSKVSEKDKNAGWYLLSGDVYYSNYKTQQAYVEYVKAFNLYKKTDKLDSLHKVFSRIMQYQFNPNPKTRTQVLQIEKEYNKISRKIRKQ